MSSLSESRCGCCGYTNHLVGVASASGPFSIMWCGVCLGLRAEPRVIFVVAELDPKKVTHMAHFDKELDQYFLGEKHLPIRTKYGSFDTRGEVPDIFGDDSPKEPSV